MLKPEQRSVLISIVLRQLPNNPTVALVEPYVGPGIAERIPSGTVRQVAEWIIDQVLAQETPDRLVDMIFRVDNGSQRLASLVELAEALQNDPGAWRSSASSGEVDWSVDGDPLHVIDGRPFVDRLSFRRQIPRPGSLDTPAVTVVQGENGHGKSYLLEYCRKLAAHWASARPDILRLAISECPTWFASLTPEVPAHELAMDLKLDLSWAPRKHEDPHRYARNLASWIASATRPGPLPAVLLLDGYGVLGVPEPVLTFIDTLVKILGSDTAIQRCLRVVLLDYDVGRLERKEFAYEDLVLEHVGDEEIIRWFERRFPDLPKYRHEFSAQAILDKVPANGPLRMRHICHLIERLSQEFEAL